MLDLTTDIESVSVFTFDRFRTEEEGDEVTPHFTVQAVNAGCRSSLELLGVRNSSVFLANSTIWVEGITDRLYLRRMLQLFMDKAGKRKFEEDVHYSFVEYGGANIIHWSFLDSDQPQVEVERLCGKAMVIVDRDGGSKFDRKQQIKNKLGNERFIELDGREIENMLPYSVIRSVVQQYERDDALILRDYEFDNYKERNFGNFVQSTMLKNVPKRRGGYQEASGTLKDKLGFCQKALPHVQYDYLPSATKKVIIKIYKFIESENQGT